MDMKYILCDINEVSSVCISHSKTCFQPPLKQTAYEN